MTKEYEFRGQIRQIDLDRRTCRIRGALVGVLVGHVVDRYRDQNLKYPAEISDRMAEAFRNSRYVQVRARADEILSLIVEADEDLRQVREMDDV